MSPARPPTSEETAAEIVLEKVHRTFAGAPILDAVSLSVAAGEIVTLLGPSGCGKSTVLRLVAGLEQPDAGTVRAPRDRLGVVFQDATLMPWASALDNVALPLRFAGLDRAAARARARDALDGVGLAQAAEKPPRALSGGMRMRVALARALVGDPEVLLMDEPFAALDEITRFRLADDLFALARRRRLAVLFVTHSVYEAVAISDRILVMSAAPGRIAAERAIAVDGPRGSAFRATPFYAETAVAVSAALAEATAASEDLDDYGRTG